MTPSFIGVGGAALNEESNTNVLDERLHQSTLAGGEAMEILRIPHKMRCSAEAGIENILNLLEIPIFHKSKTAQGRNRIFVKSKEITPGKIWEASALVDRYERGNQAVKREVLGLSPARYKQKTPQQRTPDREYVFALLERLEEKIDYIYKKLDKLNR